MAQSVEPAVELARTAERLDPVCTAFLLKELDGTASILYVESMTGRHSQSLNVGNCSPREESPIEPTLWSHWSNGRLARFGDPFVGGSILDVFPYVCSGERLESFVVQEMSQQEGLLQEDARTTTPTHDFLKS